MKMNQVREPESKCQAVSDLPCHLTKSAAERLAADNEALALRIGRARASVSCKSHDKVARKERRALNVQSHKVEVDPVYAELERLLV